MERLTPHQHEITELRCGPDELSIDEVAVYLAISRNTVKAICATIMHKLGCKTFHGVCRKTGYREGWTDSMQARAMRADVV